MTTTEPIPTLDGRIIGQTERATFTAVQADIGSVTATLYGDLPAEDLQTAARILLTITARAHHHLDTP